MSTGAIVVLCSPFGVLAFFAAVAWMEGISPAQLVKHLLRRK